MGQYLPLNDGFLCKLKVKSQRTKEHHAAPEYICLPWYWEKLAWGCESQKEKNELAIYQWQSKQNTNNGETKPGGNYWHESTIAQQVLLLL